MAFTGSIRNSYRLNTQRVAILGMFLALMVTAKYTLGFVPGIEVISFLFIIFGLFLPIVDLALLIVSFNLIVMIIYGFGTWWLAYWIIWPIDALASKMLSKVTKNKYVFAGFGFVAGFSVAFWYFLSDLIFFDLQFATLNIITAVPINLIEGFVTLVSIIVIGPKLLHVINTYGHIWNLNRNIEFKKNKYKKLNLFMSILISIASISGITVLFLKNSFFVEWKEREMHKQNRQGLLKDDSGPPNNWGHIGVQDYNNLYNNLDDHEIGLVIIANGKKYIEEINVGNVPKDGIKGYAALQMSKKFDFQYHHDGNLGMFIQEYSLKGQNHWQYGNSSSKNYGSYHPMILYNHKDPGLGISNFNVVPRDIIELTYDFVFTLF